MGQVFLKDNDTKTVFLTYGSSTWNDFIAAYNAGATIYCWASSATDPGSGTMTRLGYMAYVNNSATPTEVEFQYYRSVSSKTSSQMCDQVLIYKLTSTGTWSLTTRNAGIKDVTADNGVSLTYTAPNIAISGVTMTGATSLAAGAAGLVPAPTTSDTDKYLKGDGTWAVAANPPTTLSLTAAAGSWSSATPPTQTLTATGVTSSNTIIVGLADSATSVQLEAAQAGNIRCTAQSAGEITLTCYGTEPTENIPVSVVILG